MSNTAFSAIISGRVQMVMFRDFSARKARALGISGEVRNLSDGTVSVIAEGEKEKLDRFLKYLERGPFLAKVEHIHVTPLQPSGAFKGFAIRYS
jgi:acylphosphatase